MRIEEANSSNKSSDDEFETPPLVLSKPDMEDMANNLRRDLDLEKEHRFPALAMKINGVEVIAISDADGAPSQSLAYLSQDGAADWSAMSVPLNEEFSEWVIVRNDTHTLERQRVTYLEECWHILLGHKLTKVAKVGSAYGRTYESSEEHDAFYLASACLLPEEAVSQMVHLSWTAEKIGDHFGTSPELAEYRIKRLGLWRTYKGLQIEIGS